MESLAYYTTKLMEGLKPLAGLVPGRSAAMYVGTCVKRLIEPNINQYEAKQEAKNQQEIFEKFPLKRLEMMQQYSDNGLLALSSVSEESFINAMKIGELAVSYVRGDKTLDISSIPEVDDAEWMNHFIDEASYVTDEELQHLWARLLKEKWTRPHNVNKRVLRFLHDLDKAELKDIEESMSLFRAGKVPYDVVLSKQEFLLPVLRLIDLGLVTQYVSPGAFSTIDDTYLLSPNDNTIDLVDYQCVVEGLNKEIEVSFQSYILTIEGQVIIKLIDQKLPLEIAESFVKLVKKVVKDEYEVKLQER